MPFRPKGDEPLDKGVRVRFGASEHARLEADADLAGISKAELIRRRCFGRSVSVQSDENVLKELRRLGSLVREVQVESGGTYRTETARALEALTDYVEALSRDRQEDS